MPVLTKTRQCRYCESYEVFELKMETLWEAALLPPLFLRPYRCNRCLRKQIGFRFIKPMMREPDSDLNNTPETKD